MEILDFDWLNQYVLKTKRNHDLQGALKMFSPRQLVITSCFQRFELANQNPEFRFCANANAVLLTAF